MKLLIFVLATTLLVNMVCSRPYPNGDVDIITDFLAKLQQMKSQRSQEANAALRDIFLNSLLNQQQKQAKAENLFGIVCIRNPCP